MNGIADILDLQFWGFIAEDKPLLLVMLAVFVLCLLGFWALMSIINELKLMMDPKPATGELEERDHGKYILRSLRRITFIGIILILAGMFLDVRNFATTAGVIAVSISISGYIFWFAGNGLVRFSDNQLEAFQKSESLKRMVDEKEDMNVILSFIRHVFLFLTFSFIVLMMVGFVANFNELGSMNSLILDISFFLTRVTGAVLILVIGFFMIGASGVKFKSPVEKPTDQKKTRYLSNMAWMFLGFLVFMTILNLTTPMFFIAVSIIFAAIVMLFPEEIRRILCGLLIRMNDVKKMNRKGTRLIRMKTETMVAEWKPENGDAVETIDHYTALKLHWADPVAKDPNDFDDDDDFADFEDDEDFLEEKDKQDSENTEKS